MKRTETREQVFRLIYSSLIQKEMNEEQIEIFIEENNKWKPPILHESCTREWDS